MEQLTFKEISIKANEYYNTLYKQQFADKGLDYIPKKCSKHEIYNFAVLNGYIIKRIQINNVRKIYYIKADN